MIPKGHAVVEKFQTTFSNPGSAHIEWPRCEETWKQQGKVRILTGLAALDNSQSTYSKPRFVLIEWIRCKENVKRF